MISTLKQQVEQRFGSIEKIQIYAEATILDPRLKKYGFLNNNSFTESKKKQLLIKLLPYILE